MAEMHDVLFFLGRIISPRWVRESTLLKFYLSKSLFCVDLTYTLKNAAHDQRVDAGVTECK